MPSTRRAGGGRAPAASIVTARKLAIVNKVADAVAPRSDSEPVRLLDDAFVTDAYHQALATLGDAATIRNPGIETYVALLRLYAGLLWPSACTDAAAGTGSSAAQAGGGYSSSPPAAVIRRRSRLLATVLDVARKGCPFPTAVDALFTLIFVRGMLRAQPLHALSHQLAAAAAALEPCGGAGGESGSAAAAAAAIEQGRAALDCFLENTCTFYKVFLGDADIADLEYPSPVMVGAVAAELAADVEELARGLAESGVLEHAARVLLLLQARGPHAVRPREGAERTLAWEVLNLLYWLAWWAAGPPCISPTAAALLHSALSGRCVQTAVLVYGVGTLRLVDRGPTYGLPAALQTAGLAVCEPGQRSPGILSLVLLAGLPAASDSPEMTGPGTSVELLLRTSRAALGSAAAALPPGLQPRGGVPLPVAAAVPLSSSPCSLLGLALSALQVARKQLPARDASARQSQRREDWWRLAAGALAYGGEFLQDDEYGTDPEVVAWELCQLVTEPLLKLWPNGRRDLDALPAEPPTEVAAALAGGLPQAVMALMGSSGTGALSMGSQYVACELLEACCNPLFLTPLLVYGGSESVAAFLEMLRSARRDRHGQARAPPPAPQPCPALRVEAAEAAEPLQPPAAAAGVVGPWGMRCGAATGRSWRGRR